MAKDHPTPTGPIAPDVRILETRVYRGPNIWSYEPAVHLVVDLGVLEGYPSDSIEGFTPALVELLPGLRRHTCSVGRAGGFIERLEDGTWLGHVAEHVALELQTAAGHDLRRGKTRMVKGRTGVYNVIFGYVDETVGIAAGSSPSDWSTTSFRRRRASTSLRSLTRSCARPTGLRSVHRPPQSSRKQSAGTSRGFGSTPPLLCSSGRASTPSGSEPR